MKRPLLIAALARPTEDADGLVIACTFDPYHGRLDSLLDPPLQRSGHHVYGGR